MSEIQIINHWIDGNFQPSVSDRFGNVYNPATGAVIAKLPMGGAVDLETAVKSARHDSTLGQQHQLPNGHN